MTWWTICSPGSGSKPRRQTGLRLGLLALALALIVQPAAAREDADRQPVEPELRERLKQAVDESESFENRYVAQVWLMDMSQRLASQVPDADQRLELLRMIHFEATRAELDPELVLAVIEVESNFNRYAISSVGARGMMQIMPFWLDEIGQDDDNLFDIQTNLRFGTTILRHYLDKENGNLTRALARYNGSLGQTWYPERVYRAMERRWYAH
ncbi:lytic transglycosylase domain-containing protein [Aquisalimonas asiatica]|uniref:Transglycosylase SLT domain-containing protein n=1 Tax=Aquisalimonas asiatica TaxID=406100 RepID=A0A1H8R0S0_9GAMM|nr:lytic transglycosylase domain-containing protein [Aquisalimonas asiatica]SEO60140.1 Transglycosylase SLT domain-containing protein [Aquisalimonas asiatica]